MLDDLTGIGFCAQGRNYMLACGYTCTPKIQKLVIIVKFSPYMYHPHLILMHPHIFAIASPLSVLNMLCFFVHEQFFFGVGGGGGGRDK
jgi:hypothetical protein